MYHYRKAFGPEAMLLGFDSFAGLPDEKKGEVRRATWNKVTTTHCVRLNIRIEIQQCLAMLAMLGDAWLQGVFNVAGGTMERISTDLGSSRTRLVKGYFENTLTAELAREMKPAVCHLPLTLPMHFFRVCHLGSNLRRSPAPSAHVPFCTPVHREVTYSSPRSQALVDIDSDIYVSAYQALDWLLTHRLVARTLAMLPSVVRSHGARHSAHGEGIAPPCP